MAASEGGGGDLQSKLGSKASFSSGVCMTDTLLSEYGVGAVKSMVEY